MLKTLKRKKLGVSTFIVFPGERSKSVTTACRIYDRLLAEDLDSRSVILALGGGVVGDLAGYVAATYHRGIRFCQLPTTLLAQTDASIGGKVAINHRLCKNLIGAFHQPEFVLSDSATLRTLPVREWRNGMAEVVKYSLVRDRTFFEFLENGAFQQHPENYDDLKLILETCSRIKAAIVSEDERDRGTRKILNFGHTVGHALEAMPGGRKLQHGEAVAHGMLAAAFLSRETGILPGEDFKRVHRLITRLRLCNPLSHINYQDLWKFIRRDKKRADGVLRFVLLSGIGSGSVVDGVDGKLVREACTYILK